jgi:hypothetical protein
MLGGAFATLLQAALAATFACLERGGSFSTAAASLAWVSVLSLWGVGICWWRADVRQAVGPEPRPSSEECDGWLRQAQREYLREHWLEAELLVQQILTREPADVEARLLRASILRRTGRAGEARRELTRLAGDPRASPWRWEIQTELDCLASVEDGREDPGTGPSADGRPSAVPRQAA